MSNHPNRGGRRKPCVNPTVAEIRRAQARAGLTNVDSAALCCVSVRTWENWVAEEGAEVHRQMPAGAWKLYRYELGVLELKAFDREHGPPRTRS